MCVCYRKGDELLVCSLSVGRIGYISKNQVNIRDQGNRKATQNLLEELGNAFSTSCMQAMMPL